MSKRLCCAAILLFLSALSLAQAQNREITGEVLNAVTREAIPYPTISVVGGRRWPPNATRKRARGVAWSASASPASSSCQK